MRGAVWTAVHLIRESSQPASTLERSRKFSDPHRRVDVQRILNSFLAPTRRSPTRKTLGSIPGRLTNGERAQNALTTTGRMPLVRHSLFVSESHLWLPHSGARQNFQHVQQTKPYTHIRRLRVRAPPSRLLFATKLTRESTGLGHRGLITRT